MGTFFALMSNYDDDESLGDHASESLYKINRRQETENKKEWSEGQLTMYTLGTSYKLKALTNGVLKPAYLYEVFSLVRSNHKTKYYKYVSVALKKVQEHLSVADGEYIQRCIDTIDQNFAAALSFFCKEQFINFLVKVMYKNTKVSKICKLASLDILNASATAIDHQKMVMSLLVEEYKHLDTFSVSNMDFRSYSVLKLTERMLMHESENSLSHITALLFFSQNTDELILSFSNSLDNFHARLVCLSFMDQPEHRYSRLNTVIVLLDKFVDLQTFDGPSFPEVLKLCRCICIGLLEQMVDKRNTNRVSIARYFSKFDFNRLKYSNRKRHCKMSKLVRKCILDKSAIVVDATINILYYLDISYLINELSKNHSLALNQRIIHRIKKEKLETRHLQAFYSAYLLVTDLEYETPVQSLCEYAKAFYCCSNKSVCQYFHLTFDEIDDAYVAHLCMHYSKFRPERIDHVYIASLILESGGQILKTSKIRYYNDLLQVLINLVSMISETLRRRLLPFCRKLLYYGPYVEKTGELLHRLGYSSMEISRQSDYYITILGALGHKLFKSQFSDFPWSRFKEQALVYYLKFEPVLGFTYKWKLEELLCKDAGLYLFLNEISFKNIGCSVSEIFDAEDELVNVCDFYFQFVSNNSCKILKATLSSPLSSSASLLLISATEHRAILPEVSIPYIFVFHKVVPRLVQVFPCETSASLPSLVGLVLAHKKQPSYEVFEIYKQIVGKKKYCKALCMLCDDKYKIIYILNNASLFAYRDRILICNYLADLAHTFGNSDVVSTITSVFIDKLREKKVRKLKFSLADFCGGHNVEVN